MHVYKLLTQYFLLSLWLLCNELLRPTMASNYEMNPILRWKAEYESNAMSKLKHRFELLDKKSKTNLSRNCFFSPIQCNLHSVQDDDFYKKNRYSLFRARRAYFLQSQEPIKNLKFL